MVWPGGGIRRNRDTRREIDDCPGRMRAEINRRLCAQRIVALCQVKIGVMFACDVGQRGQAEAEAKILAGVGIQLVLNPAPVFQQVAKLKPKRSEEHTSELQSRENL